MDPGLTAGRTGSSATGRKFLHGPRGTGFLYVRKAILDGPERA
jgi:selenocysteine lyase/cysteine desulfurase